MDGVDELVNQIGELAELQVTLAERLAALEKKIGEVEQTRPSESEGLVEIRRQLEVARQEAENIKSTLESVSSLNERVQSMESNLQSSLTGADARFRSLETRQPPDVTPLLERVRSVEGRLSEIQTLNDKTRALENRMADVASIADRMKALDARVASTEATVHESIRMLEAKTRTAARTEDLERMQSTLSSRLNHTDSALGELQSRLSQTSSKEELALMQKTLKLHTEEAERLANLLQSLTNQVTAVDERVSERAIRQFIGSSLAQVAEDARKKADEAMIATENEMAAVRRRAEDQASSAINQMQRKAADAEKETKEALAGSEKRVLSELKKEAERLRESALSVIIDVQDRVKRIETVEENLEGKFDYKLNEATNRFAEMFDHSANILKQEIFDEISNELAETKATTETLRLAVTDQRDEIDRLAKSTEDIKAQLADVLAKQKGEEESLMRDLESLERRLKV
ncbi:MAG: hypothetical protein HYS81_01045 [Candidatus Aenigmatarchaeota archaeon]|nr:MAG: hypothetical protein HYS81_01045 [Candidatus Aenigmarchaeota archaeon]